MARQIYVNLPVRDLPRSRAFFAALGFGFEPKLNDDNAACMIVADGVYVMLLTKAFFAGFSPNAIADARQVTEVLVCLSCSSRGEVDELVAKAVAAGGNTFKAPQDHGFMYGHGFQDLDGHVWELIHMQPEGAP